MLKKLFVRMLGIGVFLLLLPQGAGAGTIGVDWILTKAEKTMGGTPYLLEAKILREGGSYSTDVRLTDKTLNTTESIQTGGHLSLGEARAKAEEAAKSVLDRRFAVVPDVERAVFAKRSAGGKEILTDPDGVMALVALYNNYPRWARGIPLYVQTALQKGETGVQLVRTIWDFAPGLEGQFIHVAGPPVDLPVHLDIGKGLDREVDAAMGAGAFQFLREAVGVPPMDAKAEAKTVPEGVRAVDRELRAAGYTLGIKFMGE
ncbi:MAG: hypothetical protein HY459_02535 [Parcubacteria group bacterium]|nr:hypothetical protein [Parcubacteria group bacterium]